MLPQLDDLRVLIVRPPRPQDPFARALTQLGARALELPVMRIESIAAEALGDVMASGGLSRYDKVIVLSRHAARLGSPLLVSPGLSSGQRYFTVGASTAEVLRASGLDVACPTEASSEGLLALPDLASIGGQRVLILCGMGGRETLKNGLVGRGAAVDCCELYRRVVDTRYREAIRSELAQPTRLIISAHSGELVDALVSVIGGERRSRLRSLPLLVPSQRVAERARALRFVQLVVAKSALPADMVAAIGRWYTEF